jgi:hypothetical protein
MDHLDAVVEQGLENVKAKKRAGLGVLSLTGFDQAIRGLGARGPDFEQRLLKRAGDFSVDKADITERLRAEWAGREQLVNLETFYDTVSEMARVELREFMINEGVDPPAVDQLFRTYRLTARPYS